MQLFATPLSHYSRKVRLLLDHYRIDYAFTPIGNVADADTARFQGNPVMKVPVLVDGDTWLIESDHIAMHIVRRHDANDRYRVLATDADTLNTRAILNSVMAEEVKLILAERTGLDTVPHDFFRKARAAVRNGLGWLDDRADVFDVSRPGYLEFHLVSLWDHLQHYELIDLSFPRLREVADILSADPLIHASSPRESLLRYPP